MTSDNEGLLTDVATAIGTTLGRVAGTATEMVDRAKRKVSGRPARRVKKTAHRGKKRAQSLAAAAKKVSRRTSRAAKQVRKVTASKARGAARRARRALR